MIPPPATIGILGGGQLERMTILAGRRMGYRFHVYEPKAGCAAGMVADREWNAAYDDLPSLRNFAAGVDLVTLMFENIPAATLEAVEAVVPVRPSAHVLHICQNRLREKQFLAARGFPHAPFRAVNSAEELERAVGELGYPCVLKTADFGYDGKGQVKITEPTDWRNLWDTLGYPRAVLEAWVTFAGEFSAICARRENGQTRAFPVAENEHRHHILHTSRIPARLSPEQIADAQAIVEAIAEALSVVGLLTAELFLTQSGEWVVNELAPRPHNSGHASFDACLTGQFEQHLRAVCGLPLASTELLRPAVMVNLLGDLWQEGEPDWSIILTDPNAKLHLYDKGTPAKGRKMGHFTVLHQDPDRAWEKAISLDKALRRSD